MPKLSLITINLNDAKGLEKTLSSVWNDQAYTDFEHIVIDGGSTDGSVDVIKKYADKLAYWISEPDKGIYNAMNKGIVKATGDYLLFINGGDWLAPDILTEVFKNKFDEDIVYGNFTYVKNNGSLRPEIYKRPLTYIDLLIYSIGHPASFIKKSLFDKGLYNENFRIVSDWAFYCDHIIKNRCSVRHIDMNISFFNTYGISINPKSQELTRREHDIYLSSAFDEITFSLIKNIKERESYIDYITKARTKDFLDSEWMLHKTRKCIKVLFFIKKIFRINR